MRIRRIHGFVTGCLIGASVVTLPPAAASAGEFQTSIGGLTFRAPVVSLREARFQTVIRQQYDYSCGSAAIASLLTYHYDRPTTEAEVFTVMYEAGDQEKIRRQGFSLLDMKKYLEGRGLRADGFKMSLETLAELGVPAITLINTGGYLHFVVIKGIAEGEVVIGDPALGVRIMRLEDFEAVWHGGIVFLIREEADLARKYFNHQRDWRVRQKAPLGTALTRDALANFTLLSTFMHNEF